MPAGLIVAMVVAAATGGPAVYGPAQPAPPKPPAKTAAATPAEADPCAAASAAGNTREIVICAQRPQGYRLNPDVMEARREIRSGGQPRYPHEMFRRRDCATIGPAPCFDAGINIIAAATTLATMAQRIAKGEEIGSMFVTDPHPDEYQLYRMAKMRREAREAEAEAAAEAKAKAAKAAAPASTSTPPPTPAAAP